MILAVMQPYFLPYIGYFQLIKTVDRFVIYDDVNFINKGWINRNNLLNGSSAQLFTIPLKGASQNRLIREIEIADDNAWTKKLLRTIEQTYKKAPLFDQVYPLLNELINAPERHIGGLAVSSLKSVSAYLGITTPFVDSSVIYGNEELKAQERILDICRKENADHYINPIGGMEIYSRELFETAGVKLNFIKAKPIHYRQFKNEFVPHLSIVDVLMFNSPEEVNELLDQYELI
jgi:hypothetical protein